LPNAQWQTVAWREGSRGTMRKQFVAIRRHWGIGTPARTLADRRVHTGTEGWLIGERPVLGEEGDVKYYFSNWPSSDTAPAASCQSGVEGGLLCRFMGRPSKSAVWRFSKGGPGMGFIGIWLWSCLPTVSSPGTACTRSHKPRGMLGPTDALSQQFIVQSYSG